MRYLITKDFRKLILLNQEELSKNLVLKSNIKNLIYKNKTISLNDLNKVSKIINLKDLNFKEIYFSPQKNLGKHSQSPKINFTGKNKKFIFSSKIYFWRLTVFSKNKFYWKK